jgi:5-methylcytosine-specific restriction protein A
MRAVREWIGANDDTRVPDRVRVRVFEREGGICHISGRKIAAGERWDLEHKVALCNGGRHRESNLAPALVEPHKRKTAADRAEKKIIDRKRKKHLGIRPARQQIQSRGFSKAPPQRSATRPIVRGVS